MLRLNDKAVSMITAGLCFLTALSLQIQVTLFKSPTYLGLRINLTDLLVPFAGAAILATLLARKSLWPQWRMPHVYAWMGALTALITLSLLHTHFTYGEISRWALVNKFGGWFVLVAIMGMGAWIASNATQKNLERFIKIFLAFGLFVVAHQLAILLLDLFPSAKIWIEPYKYFRFPMAGFMANRNAFGLLFICTLAIATCFHFLQPRTAPAFVVYGLYFLLPLFLVFNSSRAVFLTLCLMLPALLIVLGRHNKRTALILMITIAAGALFSGTLLHDKKDQIFIFKNTPYEFLLHQSDTDDQDNALIAEGVRENIEYPGDSMRLVILKDAQTMFGENPILGNGLGSMLLYQEKTHGQMINLIDCTPLWILVEMGAIALLIFAAFYLRVAQSLYKAWKEDEEFSKTLHMSLMFLLFAFTFMSLFHEIMYTRFIWFFLGLGLALPARMRQA